jgi:O-antigen/teichoic acid export membrane protein
VDLLDKPRAALALATQGIAGLKHSIARTRRLLLLLNGGYVAIVLLLTRPMLELAFGSRYLDHELEVQLLAVGFFLFGLNQPSETLLIILHANHVLLVTRCVALACALGALATLSSFYGALGCAGAIVCVQLVNVIGLRWAEHIATRRYERESEHVATGGGP